MNKKIKIIELLQKIANKEELPQKILIKDIVWYLVKDSEGTFTYSQTQDNDWQKYIDYKIALTRNLNEDVLILDDEVEILENNTEEIEELPKMNFFELVTDEVKTAMAIEKIKLKVDELVKVVKEIRKDLNK